MACSRWVQTWGAWLLVGVFTCTLGIGEAQSANPRKSSAAPRTAKPSKPATAQRAKAALPAKSIRSKSRVSLSGTTKRVTPKRAVRKIVERPSYGQLQGLRATDDPLDLRSSVAMVVDQDTHEVLFEKNAGAVLPIASLTKLMTSLVVVESAQPLDELLVISQDDVDTERGSRSRLAVGTQLTRGELLHLALMSSENRAAHALGRHHPGGLRAFVGAMNARAALLGMDHTRYVEPTGLSNANRSTARDLVTLTSAAYEHPLIRELSTSPEHQVAVGDRVVQYRNTNGLVSSPDWAIGLQKTGYISEAGRCLLMQAQMAGRKLIMVFLDSTGKSSRIGDARRVRNWIETVPPASAAPTTPLPLTLTPPIS